MIAAIVRSAGRFARRLLGVPKREVAEEDISADVAELQSCMSEDWIDLDDLASVSGLSESRFSDCLQALQATGQVDVMLIRTCDHRGYRKQCKTTIQVRLR